MAVFVTSSFLAMAFFRALESASVGALVAPKLTDTPILMKPPAVGAGLEVGSNVGAGLGAGDGPNVGNAVGAVDG